MDNKALAGQVRLALHPERTRFQPGHLGNVGSSAKDGQAGVDQIDAR